jgi:hypothetical protein
MGSSVRLILAVIAFLVLCATNVMTLTNDGFHLKAHNLLQSVLGGVLQMDGSTVNRTRQLRESNQSLIVANQRLIAAVVGMRVATQALSAAHELLRIKSMGLVGEHQSLLRKTEAIKIGAKGFIGRMVRRMTVSVTRGVASLVPRLTPVVGVAASVAVTAFDVADACDSVKEMNALGGLVDEPMHDESTVCGVRIPTAEELFERLSLSSPSKTGPR